MSLELRVRHLEELVVALQQQVADLQARLGSRTRESSFDFVPSARDPAASSSPPLRGGSSPSHTASASHSFAEPRHRSLLGSPFAARERTLTTVSGGTRRCVPRDRPILEAGLDRTASRCLGEGPFGFAKPPLASRQGFRRDC